MSDRNIMLPTFKLLLISFRLLEDKLLSTIFIQFKLQPFMELAKLGKKLYFIRSCNDIISQGKRGFE